MTGLLRDAGAALGVPVAGVLEGGYGLDGLARSLRVSMEALAAPAGSLGGAGRRARGRVDADRARRAGAGGQALAGARRRLSLERLCSRARRGWSRFLTTAC